MEFHLLSSPKKHNLGLFAMKVFASVKLLEITLLGEKRKLSVEKCMNRIRRYSESRVIHLKDT